MSPKDPEPILRPRRYLLATRISIVAMALPASDTRRECVVGALPQLACQRPPAHSSTAANPAPQQAVCSVGLAHRPEWARAFRGQRAENRLSTLGLVRACPDPLCRAT
eukprot:scaffold9206_cov113-Isochrysis_galbana.AAC.5